MTSNRPDIRPQLGLRSVINVSGTMTSLGASIVVPEAVQMAEKEGAELVLLGYPVNFYATTSQQVYDYTRAFCEATRLGVILFPVPHWGFERIHPAGMDPELVKRMVADIPNIVCIKAESGMPTPGGFVHDLLGFAQRQPLQSGEHGDLTLPRLPVDLAGPLGRDDADHAR